MNYSDIQTPTMYKLLKHLNILSKTFLVKVYHFSYKSSQGKRIQTERRELFFFFFFLTVTVKDTKQYQPLKINIAFQILVIKYQFIGIHVIHSFRHPQLQVWSTHTCIHTHNHWSESRSHKNSSFPHLWESIIKFLGVLQHLSAFLWDCCII